MVLFDLDDYHKQAAAAKQSGITRSHLQNYLTEKHQTTCGHPTTLSKEEEELASSYIIYMQMQNFLEITHTYALVCQLGLLTELSRNHTHTCKHRMLVQRAGSQTHNLFNRGRGGTLL